jgi:NAD-dependent DNA ligase
MFGNKEKQHAWMREYYQKHKEELKAYGRKYHAEHHPKIDKQLRSLFRSLECSIQLKQPKLRRPRTIRLRTGKQIRCVFCRTDLISDDGRIVERAVEHYVQQQHGVGCKNFDIDAAWEALKRENLEGT